jgi:ABC-type transport system involved in multi-copper enzyme maturation permease subunit
VIALTSVELTKLFRRPPLWLLLGAVGAALVLLAVAIALSAPPEAGERPSALELAVPFGILAGQVLAAIAGAALAQEYQWRTLPLWLARGVARGPLLLARFLATLPALLLVALVPVAVGLLLSLGRLEAALLASHLSLDGLALAVLAMAFGVLPYVALSLGLAVGTRAVAVPVGGVLLLALLVEPIVGQLAPRIGAYLPSSLSRTLLAGGGDGRLAAGLLIALYTAVLLAVAVAAFRRQDLTG